ncbi:MAG: tetratricopeptide repeat protein [Verrucomicrobiae bacterium]|nr:tetratricopeptide repeat protein [Verrucomicrobiae bacterium]
MKRVWGAVALVALVVAAYAPSLRGPFLWDDGLNVTRNRLVTEAGNLRRIWFSTEPADYYPVTFTVFRLQWLCWGNNPRGYRVVNLLLHAVNALLLWKVFRRVGLARAWFGAALFALHPVNVATVAWVTELKNLLAFGFAAVAVLAWLRYEDERRLLWLGTSLGAFLLALLSKTAVVPLPVVLVGLAWWRRNRLAWREAVLFFVLAIGLGLVTLWFQQHRVLEHAVVRRADFWTRLADAGAAVWFYLWKAVAPVNLSLVYPRWETNLIPAALLALVLVLCWLRSRGLFLALGGFVVMMFPMLGFFDQGFFAYAQVADHWQYFGLPLLCALAAVGVRWQVAVLLLGIWSALTFGRARLYGDDVALWRDTLEKNPLAWVAYFNLGLAHANRGEPELAEQCYRRALRLNPDYVEARNNLGNLLSARGEHGEAVKHFMDVIRLNPKIAAAHNNLGAALAQLGEYEAAVGCFREALRLEPRNAEARENLAKALEKLKAVR